MSRTRQPRGLRLAKDDAPASVIRERFRGSLSRRLPILEQIADGEVTTRTRVGLADILPHITCANCGEPQLQPSDKNADSVEIEALVSASPKDRIAALDLMAKYGPGQLKELSVESARERMLAMIEVVRQNVAPALFDQMGPQLLKAANGR